jgi:hypothetical protein
LRDATIGLGWNPFEFHGGSAEGCTSASTENAPDGFNAAEYGTSTHCDVEENDTAVSGSSNSAPSAPKVGLPVYVPA